MDDPIRHQEALYNGLITCIHTCMHTYMHTYMYGREEKLSEEHCAGARCCNSDNTHNNKPRTKDLQCRILVSNLPLRKAPGMQTQMLVTGPFQLGCFFFFLFSLSLSLSLPLSLPLPLALSLSLSLFFLSLSLSSFSLSLHSLSLSSLSRSFALSLASPEVLFFSFVRGLFEGMRVFRV